VSAMTDGFQDVPIDEIRTLKMPTMFILGDADMVKPEHAVALFRAVGGGGFGDMVAPPPSRLAILPGTTHFGLVSRSKWIAEMVTESSRFTGRAWGMGVAVVALTPEETKLGRGGDVEACWGKEYRLLLRYFLHTSSFQLFFSVSALVFGALTLSLLA
jgi:hypothetical protein